MSGRKIACVRPRLGVGGAERLVLDVIEALNTAGHDVRLFAPGNRHEREFDRAHGPLLRRDSSFGFVPSQLFGRMRLPLALFRGRLALRRALSWKPDVIFLDSLPHLAVAAKRFSTARVIAYCHYPDALLTRADARHATAYAAYRRPFDALERAGWRGADLVLANSRFTIEALNKFEPDARALLLSPAVRISPANQEPPQEFLLLNVARFDPRKNLALAVRALAHVRDRLDAGSWKRTRLVLAGHHDAALTESRKVVRELQTLTRNLSLDDHVTLSLSPSDAEIRALLVRSFAVLYPPRNEHFGYVPLDAMEGSRPVIAVRSGGPAETVVDGQTGLLVADHPEAFGQGVAALILEPGRARAMGEAGRKHVCETYSFETFALSLQQHIAALTR